MAGKTTPGRDTVNSTTSNKITAPKWVKEGWGKALEGYGQFTDLWRDYALPVAGGTDPYKAYATSMDYLSDAAKGEYLYGGAAFNQAVDAAFRAGMPGALSPFIGAGRSDGGLAKNALAQTFSDAFSRQYGQERAFQDRAARDVMTAAMTPAEIASRGAQLEQGQLAFLQPWLGSKSQTSGVSTSMPSQYQPNPWMQAAGLGLAGVGALSGLGWAPLAAGAAGAAGAGAAASGAGASGLASGILRFRG